MTLTVNRTGAIKNFDTSQLKDGFSLDKTYKLATSSGNSIEFSAGDILKFFLSIKDECNGKEGVTVKALSEKSLPSLFFSKLAQKYKLSNLMDLSKVMTELYDNGFFISESPSKKFVNMHLAEGLDEVLASWESTNSSSKTTTDSVNASGKAVSGKALTADTINLDDYITEITELVKKDDLGVVRRNELRSKLIDRLSKKINPRLFLTGNEGIGKTYLVYDLAKSIVNNDAGNLNDHKILKISLSAPNINEVLEELYKNKTDKTILYFDKFDSLFIANDELLITTIRQLNRFINDDSCKCILEVNPAIKDRLIGLSNDFSSKLDTLKVEEASVLETEDVLKTVCPDLEKKHGILIPEALRKPVIDLSNNYLSNAYFPFKAIDVLDSCCIKALKDNREAISLDDVYNVVSEKTGLPLGRLNKNERERLIDLEKIIHRRVKKQDEPVKGVSDALRVRIFSLTDEKGGTTGVFLFLGPTGVGKTELAKAICEWWTGDEKNLVRVDMGEHQEAHSIARLIGAPPGYVGYEDGGKLTNAIKNKPFGVVLLDECEKGHKAVYNLLLGFFDEGILTDGKGNTVNGKNWITIMSGNIAAKEIEDVLKKKTDDSPKTQTAVSEAVSLRLKDFFTPEQLNRFDGVFIFHDLDEETKREIIDLKLDGLKRGVKEKRNIDLTFTKSALDFLNAKLEEKTSDVYDRRGERKVNAVRKSHVDTPLVNYLLANGLTENCTVQADYEFGSDVLSFKHSSKASKSTSA